ncbi:MAG TPA: Hsp33 family molecular chaperone HslO [Spirochaetota bacterium]|nr:Hsp33 family molecular chaperone HslO [Spirochaetota bacterium]
MAEPLSPSRLYTCIDNRYGYAIHFLEGQKLIEDLALLRERTAPAFAYLRQAVLSVLPMIVFLKRDEEFGFYVDSRDPNSILKIETRFDGRIRAMQSGEAPSNEMALLSGICRIVKFLPGETTPYTSLVDFTDMPFDGIINITLARSFQFASRIILARESDQSVLLSALPPLGSETPAKPAMMPDEYLKRVLPKLEGIIEPGLTREDTIIEAFSNIDCKFLVARDVAFSCSCSKQRFVEVLRSLEASGQDPFENESVIETVCDYCGLRWEIARSDLATRSNIG